MMSAVLINVVSFNFILTQVQKPLLVDAEDAKYLIPPRGVIDARLIIGAGIFGAGWGLSGLCPGPGVICLYTVPQAVIWVASLALGQLAFDAALKQYERHMAKYNRFD